MLVGLLTLVTVPLALGAPAGRYRRQATTKTVSDASSLNGQTFDYVIAGGGLGGVVLASRLSEDSKVLLIEVGESQENNDIITDAANYQKAFDQPELDWAYKTVEQSVGGQKSIRAGKGLGGSTLINGMAWSKPHDFQLDALESVGNQGLNWATLEPYMLGVETFTPPSSQQVDAGFTYSQPCHGYNGPVAVVYESLVPTDLEHNLNATTRNFGMPYPSDLSCGNPAGISPMAHTKYASGGRDIRSDAYRAFLYEKNLPNLTILVKSKVGKVNLASGAAGSTPRATGVEFQSVGGSDTYTVSASREVIVATGAIRTPVLLQHSGIGPKAVLAAANVDLRVDLPVGQNLIDQTTSTTSFRITGAQAGGQSVLFPRFEDIFQGDNVATATNMLQNNIDQYVQDAIDNGAASSADGLRTVLELQRDWILNKGASVSENYDYSGSDSIGFDSWFLLPFGRGSVQISDSNAYGDDNFKIDPRFFTNEFDTLATGATVWFTHRLTSGSPLNTQIRGQNSGPPNANDDLSTWSDWAKSDYRSNWHPIGTVPMMSKELGGCVDSNHRVYGVDGLRVVDGSNLPFQVSSHLMSVLYGLAERAAEVIKADSSNPTDPTTTVPTPPTNTVTDDVPTPTGTSDPVVTTTPPSSSGVSLHPNGNTGKCLTVKGGVLGNDTPVELNDCDGRAGQKWDFSDGLTSVKVAGTNYCLDTGDGVYDGARAKIYTCYAGHPNQSWIRSNNKLTLQGKNFCLDDTDGSTNSGTVMQYWTCFSGSWQQTWTTS